MTREGVDAAGPTAAARGAICRIRTEGEIDGSWTDRLCGLDVATGNEIATPCGRLRDQSERIGVLNALHMLRLTVSTVETPRLPFRRRELPQPAGNERAERRRRRL